MGGGGLGLFGQPMNHSRSCWAHFGGPSSFSANGYDGQYAVVLPDLDLVPLRHGAMLLDLKDNLNAGVGEVIEQIRCRA